MLAWHSGATRHQQALHHFVCTEPPSHSYDQHRGRHHPRPWELEVQSHLRGLRLPAPSGTAVVLGFDDSGLAAIVQYAFSRGDEQFIIPAMAVARRCQHQGYGGEALDYVMRSLRATRSDLGVDCGVFARIDPRNDASRALFRSRGWEYLDVFSGLEVWVSDI